MNELKKLTGSIINAVLGPNKSNKFLIQDKDVCVSRCPLHILQNHYLQDSASVLMEETLFAHHELYGCSTLSLLAMWYFWDEEFRSALEDGCDIYSIIQYSQNILELVISSLSDIKVSINKMLISKHCPKMVTTQNSVKKVNNFNHIPLSIRYTSRHFSPSLNTLNSESQNDESVKFSEVDEKCLEEIVQNLNHDDDIKLTELIVKCWKNFISNNSCTKFPKDGVIVCPTVLPHCNSTVVDGLVIKSNLNHTQYQDVKSGDVNRTLIIMGSITYKYVHLGFAPKVSLSVQTHDVTLLTKEEEWRKRCCDLIMQLNINVLVIKDDIDEKIADFCFAHSVLVFPQVPLKIFKILCKAMKHFPCSYLWDCKEENVIKNLTVKEWKPNDYFDGCDQYFLLSVNLKNTLPLQTIVICHPSSAVLEMLEHQTYHLISRLSLTLQNKSLLPGGAETEKRCIDLLRKHPQFQKPSDPATRIMTAISRGFQNYVCVVTEKKHMSARNINIMDEMSAKVNAWRSALALVLLTLQCDTAIINGIEESQAIF